MIRSNKYREVQSLVGEPVAVAYNLAQCGRTKPESPDDACFTIRMKPTSSSVVVAYEPRVILKDVRMVTQDSVIRAIQKSGQRSVGAFVVGTLMPLETRVPETWMGLGISPVPPPKGRGETQFVTVAADGARVPVTEAAWFMGVGRRSAVSTTAKKRKNPGRGVTHPREVEALFPEIPPMCDPYWEA